MEKYDPIRSMRLNDDDFSLITEEFGTLKKALIWLATQIKFKGQLKRDNPDEEIDFNEGDFYETRT